MIRYFTVLCFAVLISSLIFANDGIKMLRAPKTAPYKEMVVKKKMIEPQTAFDTNEKTTASSQPELRIKKSSETTYHALVDSSRNGYGWLNSSIRGIDFFKGQDASGNEVAFVLLGYRQYITSNPASGIIGASTINVANGLANAGSSHTHRYTELNQDLYNGTIGGRYPGVVALDRPFVAFNQYISGNSSTTPAVSSPYLITDYGSYGANGGAWTPSYKMDQGYTHHDSPSGNRLWNGPATIVKDASNAYHYCAIYSNWYLDSEGQDNDYAIMNASSSDPTSAWTIDTDPTLVDPATFTLVSPNLAMNSNGFGVIASAGHSGSHDGTNYLYSELRVSLMTTTDYGSTWSSPRTVEWAELGIPTTISLNDSLEYYVDDTTTAFYEGDAFVGTNFDMDVVVSDDNEIYIGFNMLWGRPSTDGWFPHYYYAGPCVAVSQDSGAHFSAHRIAVNNGFFVGDSVIPGMSAIFFDSEIDLALDEQGNLYAGWLDRPSSPVELAEKPRYSATADPDYKTDVFAARSDDGGVTWGERINITNSLHEDEYQLKLAKSASSWHGGTVYVGYCLVDPNSPVFSGGDDIYTDRVNRIWVSEAREFPGISSIGDPVSNKLTGFSLSQNYPNPFNPNTRIEFTAGNSGIAKIDVYDVLGRKVDQIFNGQVVKNNHYKIDYNAGKLAAGIYFYRLTNGNSVETKKMILIK